MKTKLSWLMQSNRPSFFTRLSKIFSLFMMTVLIGSACTGSAGTSAAQPLRVGWSVWAGWYPIVIAQEKGLFEKHGVNVEVVFYEVYGDIVPDVGSGMLDGGGLALGDAMLNNVSEDIKVILITDVSNGADQIIASPEIKSVQDLRGKRVGMKAGTYGELLVQEMLVKNGLSRSDVTFVEVPPEDMPNAIPGTVDAGHSYEPFSSQGKSKGIHPVFSSADIPGLVVDVFGFRKDTLQRRPEDVRNFIAAWFEALKFWQENPEEGNAIIAKALNIDPKEISLEGIEVYDQAQNLKAFQKSDDTKSIYYAVGTENQFHMDRGINSYPVQMDATFLDPSFLK